MPGSGNGGLSSAGAFGPATMYGRSTYTSSRELPVISTSAASQAAFCSK
jgi:hypothetical protein